MGEREGAGRRERGREVRVGGRGWGEGGKGKNKGLSSF